MEQLHWTEAQWELVNGTITEEFTKASVAGAFLPCFGPLECSQETVREEALTLDKSGKAIRVENDRNLRLWNLTAHVELSHQQVVEQGLSSALLAFRRAAIQLARAEDYIVFEGYSLTGSGVSLVHGIAPTDIAHLVVSGDDALGLSQAGTAYDTKAAANTRRGVGITNLVNTPTSLVGAITTAIVELDRTSHSGPYACILGNQLYVNAHAPTTGSLVLPVDRILPLLSGGPLLRSSNLEIDKGLVVALGGQLIDLVVASAPCAQFLQITTEAKYLFRVYERFVLRIKDRNSNAQQQGAVYCFSNQ